MNHPILIEGEIIMIKLVGFDSDPKHVVLWLENGEPKFKTVCFDFDEVQEVVGASQQKGHFHYGREYIIMDMQKVKDGVAV